MRLLHRFRGRRRAVVGVAALTVVATVVGVAGLAGTASADVPRASKAGFTPVISPIVPGTTVRVGSPHAIKAGTTGPASPFFAQFNGNTAPSVPADRLADQ